MKDESVGARLNKLHATSDDISSMLKKRIAMPQSFRKGLRDEVAADRALLDKILDSINIVAKAN